MQAFKTMLIIAAGLGATWIANSLTGDNVFDTGMSFQSSGTAGQAPDGTTNDEDLVVDYGEITAEDIEADLARIESALNEDEELEEFVPSEPLSADLGVEFPSDI